MRDDARTLFASVLGDTEQTALLLDSGGMPLAGSYVDSSGRDIAAEIGAALSGVSTEVARSMRHLSLGAWTALVVETDAATVALAPVTERAFVMLAAGGTVPIGMVRRVLARSVAIAAAWLGRAQ
ncbi:MAG: hypothetical protein H0T21_09355 [Gemmatimonadaceae bacterium]|nr:hypothetical protein [Gemmatimonadaceae bacterium]